MKSIESPLPENHIAQDVDERIRDILDGPPVNNYQRRQMQLAVEKFVTEQPEAVLDHDALQSIMLDWADSDSSKGFKSIAQNPQFETHPRFRGDISRITLEDVQYCIETGEMPEA